MVAAHGLKNRIGAIGAVLALGLSVLAVSGASPVAAVVPFAVRGSINQVSVTGLTVGAAVVLHDSGGHEVSLVHADWDPPLDVADAQGAYLFRHVPAGSGYTVISGGETSDPVVVTAPDDNPAPAFYDQPQAPVLSSGFTYVPTRDGTTLSANITFPNEAKYPKPWPVLIDYSGYDPSQPGGAPSEAALFPFQGYVVVGLNVRGTTCSGGAFDFFEELQNRDGYDAVEMLANQPWANGDVGMVGLSYMGISQLFVAQTQPPHLRAITPLSVIADTFRSTLYPGGILNTGFAVAWANDRVNGAKPAAHQWVKDRIAGGDTTCAANQKLRLQSVDLVKKINENPYYLAAGGDELAPRTFVHKITVPTYMGGAFQDEQTGGAWSTMLKNFAPGTTVRAFLTNGVHAESLAPQDIARLIEFVDFYVGKHIPHINAVVRAVAPSVLGGAGGVFGGNPIPLPADRFTAYATYAQALAAYQAEPPIRVVWENGAGRAPGEPQGTAESAFSAWPVPGAVSTSFYLQPDGRLGSAASAVADHEARATSSYVYDPSSKRASTYDGNSGDIFKTETQIDPTKIHWNPLTEGDSSSYVTEPLAAPMAVAGEGAVDLWLASTATDTDIEVTLTEVRPDGQEEYIQSGWLRASHRELDAATSTDLAPFHTDLAADAALLTPGHFVPVQVALFPFAHVLRAGSRLRLNIEAPGGNQPLWKFESLAPDGHQVNQIGHSLGRPSRVLLPVLPTSLAPNVPAVLPACPALRNQPCRAYLPARVATSVTGAADGVVTWVAPASGDTPDQYRITALPGGQSVDVAGDATTAAVPGLVLGTSYSFTVTAIYGTVEAPASDASLALVAVSVPPTTTTTTAAPVTTVAPTTEAPVPTSGTLPQTGTDPGIFVLVGLMLVLAGVVLVAFTRRRRRLTI